MKRRPDPDALVAELERAALREKRGKLTVFFGAAPGVGKTYAMLAAAREARDDERRDVVVGIVETHGRKDTAALASGLLAVPRREVLHRGIALSELDLDAVLARAPEVVLVDELAHQNPPALRHTKRWQDVDELLAAGIDVFTTLNVQHLESLVDVVAQITGIVVRETVPDAVFHDAYEVRVVDLPVDELLDRLREGKVYAEEQAARAAQSFFREGNLIALRELALRRTAERVEAKMRSYKAAHGIEPTWATSERILVCVSPSPSSERLVRAARRMASSLHGELVGVYVETPASIRMKKTDRERLARNMRLVESLAGESVVLRGEDAATEIVAYARKRNVTKIVLGKPTHPRWRDVLRPSFLDDVVRKSHEIDVQVISGDPIVATTARPSFGRSFPATSPLALARAAGLVALATGASWVLVGRSELADVVMIHLLAIVLVAMRDGYVASLFATMLGVVAVDVVFVPPYFSLAVTDFRHVATFGVMFVVALVISHLTRRIRVQADSARAREQRTAGLFAALRELGTARSRDELLAIASRHVAEAFSVEPTLFVAGPRGLEGPPGASALDDGAQVALDWAFRHDKVAGRGTETLPGAPALVVPLRGSEGPVGVLALRPGPDGDTPRDPDERQLLETIARLVGSALERARLADDARAAELRAEAERLRNALLSSVSHDLRTPLGVVTGATSALLDDEGALGAEARRELLQTAHDEADRLSHLVRNLLDMTRLEAGAIVLRTQPESVEEIVGSVLERVGGRRATTDIPSDLRVVCDSALLGQALINLVENAANYSPPDAPIHLAARRDESRVAIEVSDRGRGVADADKPMIFEKFYRADASSGRGVGLGLTVARGIVEAHGGTLTVHDRDGGGATFRALLPGAPSDDPELGEDYALAQEEP